VQEVLPTTHVIRENPLTAGQANIGKGLDANKGSNYDKMYAQAVGKDINSFGGGTVVRDFKEKMVKQIYTKILKQDKPKPQAMNKYLEVNSPQYSELIAKHVKTNNSNLKRMSKKDKIKLKVNNKGRKVKKAVINPDDFEDILGKVNIDTRNPVRRLSDAFKYRTQYRTEPEFFKGGTKYTVDGKTSSQYKASKTDKGTNIKQPSWFGKLAIGVGSKRKNKAQFTENTNPFQIQALREVFKEQWVQQYIGKDKTITKLYDDVMGRGETWDEGSLRVTLEGESTSKISKNVALNKLLGRLKETQVRLNKKVDSKTNNNEINPQWILDANINAKKIKIVKDEIKEGDIDVARQSDSWNVKRTGDWGMMDRKYTIDESGNIKKTDPKPRDRWGDGRQDSIGEESQTTFFNVSDDIWKAVAQKDQRLRLGPSETENLLKPDFSLPDGPAFITGTKPSSTVSPTIKTLGDAKDKTRSVLMASVGVIEGSSTSASRRSLGKNIVNFMEETFEKSKQKQAKNVINTDNPVDSLSEFIADPKNASKFDTPAFRKASQKLDTQQVPRQSTSFGSKRKVLGMDMDRFRQNIRSDNKPKPVGLKQQAPLASSLATSVGELFKPSETTVTEQPQF
ncbi:MAG: hypothetical protein ABGZ19_00370, partial [Verrucomicrobiales bacterium]